MMTKSQLVIQQSAQQAYQLGRGMVGLEGKFLAKIPYRYVKRNSWLEKKIRSAQAPGQVRGPGQATAR